MKKQALIVVIFFTITTFAHTQTDFFNLNVNLETKICPFNDGIQYSTLKYWDIYQTVNNKYDGILDTNHACIEVKKVSNQTKVFLNNVDLERPIFFKFNKAKFDTIFLNKNALYLLATGFSASDNYFKSNIDCDTSFCNRMFVLLKYPNEKNDGEVEKLQINYASISEGNINTYWQIEQCLTTSKLDRQYIDDIVLEVMLDSKKISNSGSIVFFGLDGGNQNFVQTIDHDLLVNNAIVDDNEVLVSFYNIQNFTDINFILHSKDGYPSNQNIDQKYLKLIPNPSEKKIINLIIEDFQQLYFQDYVVLSPELVNGATDVYHELNIVQDGGEMCVFLIELLFNNANYVYKKGEFNIDGSTACTFFSNGSKLIIDKGAKLYYGNQGNGILALSDAAVDIKSEGSLIFDGSIHLKSMNELNSIINLEPGAKLVLTENVKIVNLLRQDEKLLIKGYPYQVDMASLKEEHKAKIKFEIPSIHQSKTLVTYPNPVFGTKIHLPFKYDNTKYELFDVNGKNIQSGVVLNSTIDIQKVISSCIFLKIGNEVNKISVIPNY